MTDIGIGRVILGAWGASVPSPGSRRPTVWVVSSESELRVDAVVSSDRVRVVRRAPLGPGPVLYWLQRAQRAEENAALELALALARRWERGVRVLCVVDADEAGMSERTALFALQGLRDVRDALRVRGVPFTCTFGDTVDVVRSAASRAAALVTERAYLRPDRAWRSAVAEGTTTSIVEVEGDVIVPVDIAATRAAYAARSLRPTLMRLADGYVRPLPVVATPIVVPEAGEPSQLLAVDVTNALDDPAALLSRLAPGGARRADAWYVGGASRAREALDHFIEEHLDRYVEDRRHAHLARVSRLGMYLRFGQIAPSLVLRAVRAADRVGGAEERDAFVEELLVRRELAANYVTFTPGYDSYDALPAWSRATLAAHAGDVREHQYDRADFEAGETHDPYWNAAMAEMRESGYLHNHMRMYWGKKILEWSPTPEEAYATALALNDAYLLDGRDPNSYANVGWIFGLHDRPWFERPVFGTVRYMNANGLRRKTDPDAYVRWSRNASRADAPHRARSLEWRRETLHGDRDQRRFHVRRVRCRGTAARQRFLPEPLPGLPPLAPRRRPPR